MARTTSKDDSGGEEAGVTSGGGEPVGRASVGEEAGVTSTGRVSVGVTILLLAVGVVGMAAGSPASAGPDEPVHQATAWYVTERGLPPTTYDPSRPSVVTAPVPAALLVEPCFAHASAIDASCQPPRAARAGFTETGLIANYPPPFYWLVGLGQRAAAATVGERWADVGGRLVAALVLLLLLAGLAVAIRRRGREPAILLFLATPIVPFLVATAHPSGLEIVAGLLLAAALGGRVGVDRPSGVAPWRWWAPVAAAAVLLAVARPGGAIWVAGLVLASLAMVPGAGPVALRDRLRRSAVRAPLLAVVPALVLGAGWLLTHSASVGAPSPGYVPQPPTPWNVLTWLALAAATYPVQLEQLVGQLGWLDTPAPLPLVATLVVAWGWYLARAARRGDLGTAAILVALLFGVAVPIVLAASRWGEWPGWWQGRYQAPFVLGFLLLVLLRAGPPTGLLGRVLGALTVGCVGLMVGVNAIRYAVGLVIGPLDLALPARLDSPALGPERLVLALGCALVLVAASIALLAGSTAWRRDRAGA